MKYGTGAVLCESFPSHIATTGTPSLVLIFHPRYIGDFRTQCEGLGTGMDNRRGKFDLSNARIAPTGPAHSFVVNGASYNVNLRGRAWILADSYPSRAARDGQGTIPKIRSV